MPQERRLTACQRCGRSDLRMIHARGICVFCYNRQRELLEGRNAKGFPPQKIQPLSTFSVSTEAADGTTTHHSVDACHQAEATCVIAHVRLPLLPQGAHLSEKRPGEAAWSEAHHRFVLTCPKCGHRGLMERQKGGIFHHHCPACEGRPYGSGWGIAKARAAVMLLDVDGLKAWLDATKEELPLDRWSFTGLGCRHCRSAVLQ